MVASPPASVSSPWYEWMDVGERFVPYEPGYVHKFQRAVMHLNAITYEVGDFITAGLHTAIEGEPEAEDGWVILRPGPVKPLPGAWPLYLGDFLTNARASLDYLVYELVRANQHDPGNHTQFPICETPGKWRDDITERDTNRGPAPTTGLSEEAFAIIHEHQPLRHRSDNARKSDPLMHLLRMSNADKHRTLHVAAIYTGRVLKVWAVPEGIVDILRVKPAAISGPIEGEREVARIKVRVVPGADPDANVYFGYQRLAQITFSGPGETRTATLEDLFGIINSIMEIGDRLEGHTGSKSTWFADLRRRLREGHIQHGRVS